MLLYKQFLSRWQSTLGEQEIGKSAKRAIVPRLLCELVLFCPPSIQFIIESERMKTVKEKVGKVV